MSIADKAKGYAQSAQASAERARALASASGLRSSRMWDYVEYAGQSARRAQEYASAAAGYASAHNIPTANAQLRACQNEAYGASSNADQVAQEIEKRRLDDFFADLNRANETK